MAIVTGDRYLENLVNFVQHQAGPLLDGSLVLKLNPVGLHYVQSRLDALREVENLLSGAPVDYLRAYISDLGDHRALEQLRRILRLLTSLKDALRHVFASRIAEIKGSPQWNRLSFVSCACNRLVLMDESLQLLPAVETLDLSRNKFAKDNLRKCTKLKHLDLGFNHLRTTAPFSEVSCHIGKLVLRNNALTTLRGLENLKSLEGLDISYNIISNFSELEFLARLTSLQNLWLEGNPLCCARWYRAQVFSYFAHSDTKKVPRLAAIESEEESAYFSSDQESPSCDNDIQSKEENIISDNEAEMVDLINRVELMKREDSILWLREFQEWMDHESENSVDGGTHSRATLHHVKENHQKNKTNEKHHGESSRNVWNSLNASGDEASTDGLESDASFVGMSLPGMVGPRQKYKISHSHEGLTIQGDHCVVENGSLSTLTAVDDTSESHSFSAYSVPPPLSGGHSASSPQFGGRNFAAICSVLFSGNILSLLGWHRVEDVKEVVVGLGLQVVRVYIERGATYLFLTRSIEKSRQLLYTLQVFGPCATNKCILRSLEQVQVELFEKQICGGSKMSIFQYAMVLFWHKDEGISSQ
ncbi:hypothetical protein GH714_023789 [Hevea brasiliensis]|uniref:Uncharacterized protein n=1 Tax=Hevea brasiliensis TaxID=3981 RepID=A0A6A6MY58_HEVBR|nr:hypothetical protein GH714_023789 [Hevea brasiliensis]